MEEVEWPEVINYSSRGKIIFTQRVSSMSILPRESEQILYKGKLYLVDRIVFNYDNRSIDIEIH